MAMLVLLLLGGIIKDDFPVDQDSVKGWQLNPVVAVAPNGNFAVAWESNVQVQASLQIRGDVYVRFFDGDGDPITSPRRVNEDSIAIQPQLSIDDSGHIVCIWKESNDLFSRNLCGMVFDFDGEPVGSRFTVAEEIQNQDHAVGCNPPGGFLVIWPWGPIWGQRYNSSGLRLGERFAIYSPERQHIRGNLSVDLSRDGSAVTVWHYSVATMIGYLRFQIVDSSNQLVIADSFSRVTYDSSGIGWLHCVPRAHWFDDERFAIFWLKAAHVDVDMTCGVQAKLFNSQGDSLTGIVTLLNDNYTETSSEYSFLSVSSPHNGLFAVAYERGFDETDFRYRRASGFIADTSLHRVTSIFRLASSDPHYSQTEDACCVDANAERIVWVWQDNSQKRRHDDTTLIDPYYTDIHCKITNWDLEGIGEQPVLISKSDWKLITSVGPRIVFKYSDRPQGFHAAIYNTAGQRIDELHSNLKSGVITWGEGYSPGVYFIKAESETPSSAWKVVLIR